MVLSNAVKAVSKPLVTTSPSRIRVPTSPTGRTQLARVLSRPLDYESSASESEGQEELPAEAEGLYPPEPLGTSDGEDVGLLAAARAAVPEGASPGRLNGSSAAAASTPHRAGGTAHATLPSPGGAKSPLPLSAPPPPELPDLEELAAGSPFLDISRPITVDEAQKMIVMAPVALLRTLLLVATVVFGWIVMECLLRVIPGRTKHAAVQRWIQAMCNVALLLAGFYHVPVKGRHNLQLAKASRAIVVFNHVSYVDPVVLVSLLPLSGVAKAGVARLPFIGGYARAMQWMFVERRGTSDAANKDTVKGNDAVDAIRRRACDTSAPLLVMAPEATTKPQHCLLKFRRGAFEGSSPVCPVLLTYTHERFNPGWGIVPSTPLHLARLLCQVHNRVSVEVLPPYFPNAAERADPTLFAAGVRETMARALGAPMVEQGITEERLLSRGGVNTDITGSRIVFTHRKCT